MERAEWLTKRKVDITGTAVSVLFGLNPWSSVKKLYDEKILGKKSEFVMNSALLAGRIMEDAVLNALPEIYGIKVSRYNGIAYYRIDEFRVGATPDAFVEGNSKQLIEAKTFKSSKLDEWREKPPLNYLSQIHTQLLVVPNSEFCYLIGLSKNLDEHVNTVLYKVTPNPEIADMIKKTVMRFWEDPVAFSVIKDDKVRITELMGQSWELMAS